MASTILPAKPEAGAKVVIVHPRAARISSPSGLMRLIKATGAPLTLTASATMVSSSVFGCSHQRFLPRRSGLLSAKCAGMNRLLSVPAILLTTVLAAGCRSEESTTIQTTDTAPTETSSTLSSTTTGSTGGTVSQMSDADKEFVIKAAQGGMAEVAMGRLAAEKASHADVKAFGQRMVTDHGKANDELASLATVKGLALATEVQGKHKDAASHLTALSGKEFDKMYVMHMIEDHEADVKAFETASQTAQDADLKAWAAKTLPTLQDHTRQVKALQAKLK